MSDIVKQTFWNKESCPKCAADWRMGEGSRLVGIYSLERDMTVEWLCRGCSTRWDRFTEEEVNNG